MGLGISAGYPGPIDRIGALKNLRDGNEFPIAADIAARLVTLPLHPFVENDDIREMVRLVVETDR